MSDFTVLRSLDGYCLVLDKKRIAGGKPDYRGENVLVDWTTEVAYGPVDDLAAENAKLREQIHWLKQGDILHVLTDQEYIDQCERERLMQVSIDALDKENAKLREQLEGIVGRSFRTADKMACLEAENDKLRELVEDMAAEIRGLGVDFARVGWCDYADRMRELGVDFDG